MDADSFAELMSAGQRGVRAVEYGTALLDDGVDPLRAATALRRQPEGLSPSVATAAFTQATLRRRAREKFGTDAERMWFTSDGVEQATRPEVADHRAARFARLNDALGRPAAVADLCCGIGADLRAIACAGCRVTGYDRDPLTAAVACANLETLAIPAAAVECLDVETLDRARFDAVFLDPARRRDGRRTFDVHAYSPSWAFVEQVLRETAAVKVAPGIPHELVPAGVEAEWVSFRGALKEAVLWSGPLASSGTRTRATLLPGGDTLTDADEVSASVRAPGRFLHEPDAAVVRAGLVGAVARLVGGGLLDPTTAYITSDRAIATPFARAFEIDAVMPFSLKRLRAELRARGVGAVTIMKRGSAVDVEKLRRDLKLSGDGRAVVILALVGGKHHALVASPVS